MDIKQIDEIIKSNKTVVIDFFATWCGPCKMLTPIIHKLEQDLNYIKFITIDVDANSDLAQRFNVSSIPTLFIYHNAKLAGKKTGYQGYEELASWILNVHGTNS